MVEHLGSKHFVFLSVRQIYQILLRSAGVLKKLTAPLLKRFSYFSPVKFDNLVFPK